MPPRVAGEISPPAAHIDAWLGRLGINSHSLDYVYQGVTIPGAVMLYHWLFSFAFAFLYVFISADWPKIRLWYGAAYGLIFGADELARGEVTVKALRDGQGAQRTERLDAVAQWATSLQSS